MAEIDGLTHDAGLESNFRARRRMCSGHRVGGSHAAQHTTPGNIDWQTTHRMVVIYNSRERIQRQAGSNKIELRKNYRVDVLDLIC